MTILVGAVSFVVGLVIGYWLAYLEKHNSDETN